VKPYLTKLPPAPHKFTFDIDIDIGIDRQTTCNRNTTLCTIVHRAVIKEAICIQEGESKALSTKFTPCFLPSGGGFAPGPHRLCPWNPLWDFCSPDPSILLPRPLTPGDARECLRPSHYRPTLGPAAGPRPTCNF